MQHDKCFTNLLLTFLSRYGNTEGSRACPMVAQYFIKSQYNAVLVVTASDCMYVRVLLWQFSRFLKTIFVVIIDYL